MPGIREWRWRGKEKAQEDGEDEPMITAVHHIAIIVSSERSLDFYRLLGFQETFRKKRKYDTAVLMDGYGMQLEVFIDPNHPSHISGSDEPIGLRHFALKVGKIEDEIERLRAESTEVIDVGPIMEDWTGVRFCFVKDFDGLSIELHE